MNTFIERLETLEAANQAAFKEINRLLFRIETLEERLAEASPKKQTFMERISAEDATRIMKLRADLFHNPDAKQGGRKYNLKVMVWLDDKKGNRGHIAPLFFNLNDPVGEHGFLTRKGGKKGTDKILDHEATRIGELLTVRFGDAIFKLSEYSEPKSDTEGTPIATWYWNKSKVTPAPALESIDKQIDIMRSRMRAKIDSAEMMAALRRESA